MAYNIFITKKVIKEIENIFRAFLWKGTDADISSAKVSWEIIYRPKSEGGLRLKRLSEWNVASLVRLVRMLFNGKDTLIDSMDECKCFKRKEFLGHQS